MPHSDQDRLIALCGIHQAAHCVQRIANRGTVDSGQMEPCVYSLFQIDAEDVPSVFGSPGAVTTGARQVIAQLTGQPERDLELTRYAISMMKHERLLANRGDMMAAISDGLEAAAAARVGRSLLDRSVLSRLAGIYSATVSKLEPRIIVRGNPQYLQNPENQERIRALLLAGIRAAMLWRQVGGRRTQILLGRKRLLENARGYLSEAATA